jgi:hypothetical protein
VTRATGHQLHQAARIVWCPDDSVLGIPMYDAGVVIARREFIDSLAGRVWPTGMIVLFPAQLRGRARLWTVYGPELVARDGELWRAEEDRRQPVLRAAGMLEAAG